MPKESNRFQQAYAKGETPWDSGVPSAELLRVLSAGGLPGKSLLELGCGTGTNALELARRGYRVTAVDYVEQAVEQARAKARAGGTAGAAEAGIDFRLGNVLSADLGGPYDVLFDRGVYHHLRRVDLPALLKQIEQLTRPGTRWLSLAGNAREPHEGGPPTVHEHELRAELEPLFEILELREFRFGTTSDEFRPLAWSILMARKKAD